MKHREPPEGGPRSGGAANHTGDTGDTGLLPPMYARSDHPHARAIDQRLTTAEIEAIGRLGHVLHLRGGSALRSELLAAVVVEGLIPRARLSHTRGRRGLAKAVALGYVVLTGDDRDPLVTLVER